jgi:hypothetical protein
VAPTTLGNNPYNSQNMTLWINIVIDLHCILRCT